MHCYIGVYEARSKPVVFAFSAREGESWLSWKYRIFLGLWNVNTACNGK